jgi:hypothetical protein
LSAYSGFWKFAGNWLRRRVFCPIFSKIAGGNCIGKTLSELCIKEETGLRCGGRGKSEISPAL